MTAIDGRIRKIAIISCFILIAVQVFMILWFKGEQASDAATYLKLATRVAETSSWYPNTSNLSSKYLFGVGYVNILALLLRITTDLRAAFFLNLLFTLVILFSGTYIAKNLFNSDRISYFFIIIFSAMTTFWGEVVSIRTELPFTAFAFLAIAFLVSQKKYHYFICGVLLGLANWVRPLALAFTLAAIIWLILKKKSVVNIVSMLTGVFITILIIGTISYKSCGYFVFQSTTSGYNLVMGANDLADGSYSSEIFHEGNAAYLSQEQTKDMIFSDYNHFYSNVAIKWIFADPLRWISLFPAKFFYMYATETYTGSSFFNNTITTGGISYIKELVNIFTGSGNRSLRLGDLIIIWNQIYYMIIIVLFIAGTVLLIKKRVWPPLVLLFTILVLGTAMTVITVGGARYHFPYLPIFFMLSAVFAEHCLNKKEYETKI